MESYLSNIDNYMKQHEEEMILQEQQRQHQQYQQQQQAIEASPSLTSVSHDEWVLRSPSNQSTTTATTTTTAAPAPAPAASSSYYPSINSFLNRDDQLFIPNVQLDYIPTNYTQPLHPWLGSSSNTNTANTTSFQSTLLSPSQQQQQRNTSMVASDPSFQSQSPYQQQEQQQQQQQQQQQPPVPQRRKPGRKPNPAAPALRKAQNRAAQRAFRERKERHVRELEETIQGLQEKNEKLNKELNSSKQELESYKAETWYLKGLVLTLHFICMHHNIKIPSHSPYLTERELAKMAKDAPHTIAAYATAYTNNNKNLKSSLAYHYAHSLKKNVYKKKGTHDDDGESIMTTPSSDDSMSQQQQQQQNMMDTSESPQSHSESAGTPSSSVDIDMSENEANEWWCEQKEHQIPNQLPAHPNLKASLKAIEQIRRKLGVQSSLLYSTDSSAARLRPTMLQLAVPHDPRIDLVPLAHMRDRMILFRSQLDYDRCFSIMINKGIFHGGDPTESKNWEMPAEFFSEFWYLTIDYDIERTNRWRKRQGLSAIEAGPLLSKKKVDGENKKNNNNSEHHGDYIASIENFYQHPEEAKVVEMWETNLWSQVLQDMPDLQPVDEASYPMSPPSQKKSMDIYETLMSSPESRPKVENPPTLENILKVMDKLSISQERD